MSKTLGQIGYEALSSAFEPSAIIWASLDPKLKEAWEEAASAITAGYLNQIVEQWKNRHPQKALGAYSMGVTSLPPGATPIYDKDPGVTSFVIGEDPTDE